MLSRAFAVQRLAATTNPLAIPIPTVCERKPHRNGRLVLRNILCSLLLCCAVTAFAKTKVHNKKLFQFDTRNGFYPNALVQGTDGNFYGSTFGSIAGPPHHHYATGGLIFRITPDGALTTLYTFCTQPNCPDGTGPYSHLILATDGNFYGTTIGGGANSSLGGTIFKITPSGALTTIYSFCALANCADGSGPGQLIQASDGNFYGTTTGGGANADGTIFKITPQGTLTILHNFCSLPNCTDGSNAGDGIAAGLTEGTDGNFYGTTGFDARYNGGTVFKITPQGNLSTLYTFCSQPGCPDGEDPLAGVMQATDGNFYGTTYGGEHNLGTFFQITPAGALATMYSFCSQGGCADGYSPATVPVQGTDGNLYGTTSGTHYSITLSGTFQTLNYMANTYPNPGTTLIQSTNGAFYGTTPRGGGYGTVYSMAVVGLGPFVETVQNSGKVGASVMILGQGFTGTTGVSFNGAAASYNVVSDTYLTAIVPAGASSGSITVATPSGTLTSNKPFVVRK